MSPLLERLQRAQVRLDEMAHGKAPMFARALCQEAAAIRVAMEMLEGEPCARCKGVGHIHAAPCIFCDGEGEI